MDNLLIMWIVLAIVFAIIEAVTFQIVTLWFAVGAVGALIANVLGASSLIQLIVFVAVSVLTLVIARPYLKKFTKTKAQPTNADVCIGKQAVVTEEINNTLGTGQAKIRGVVWTARSEDENAVILKDTLVTVKRIEGVKLIVSPEVTAE